MPTPMPNLMRSMISALSLCLLLILGGATVHAQDDRAEFLLISDIHFNPFGDSTFTRALAAADVSEWEKMYLAPEGDQYVSAYGYDSNFWLMRSALAAAAEEVERPKFIIYPGDFMAHKWYAQYVACFGSDEGYAAFTRKALAFMGLQFNKYFAGVPVIPTLGNDDALCGDYLIQAGGVFLKNFIEVWEPYMHLAKDEVHEVRDDFAVGGYYQRRIPGLHKHNMIVLNTIFMHEGYPGSTCDDGAAFNSLEICKHPNYKCELQWLRSELAIAKIEKRKVWLLMHIPPGLNAYSTSESGQATSFWNADAMAYFTRILEEFHGVVQLAFAGHTHMDDYRILEHAQGKLLTKIAPSVSPIFDNNPAFQVYEFGQQSGKIYDFTTYVLDIGEKGMSRKVIPTCLFPKAAYMDASDWDDEYEYNDAYDQNGLNAASVTALMQNAASRKKYANYYGMGSKIVSPGILAQLNTYGCCVLSATPAQYDDCN